nr:unnamed protein product [Callosobruchus chinensis]
MNEDSGGPGPPSDTGRAGNTITDNISNSQPEESINNYDLNNKYLSTDKGPYFVYMEHKSKNLGRLFPIKVGHFLQQNREFKNDILDIQSIVLNTIDNFPELPPSSYASVTNSIRKPSFRNNYQTRLPPPKKRKTSNSQLTPGTSCGRTKISKSQPVIPNPYRDEFIQHKESMVLQVSSLIINLLNSPAPISQKDIQERLSAIFDTNTALQNSNSNTENPNCLARSKRNYVSLSKASHSNVLVFWSIISKLNFKFK